MTSQLTYRLRRSNVLAGDTGDRRGVAPVALVAILLTVGYALGALAAFNATDVVTDGVKLFAPAGMSVAALLCTERRHWPVLLGLVGATELAIDMAHGYPAALNAAFALANVSHPLITASLVRRWGPAEPFASPGDLLRFLVVAGTAGPMAAAVIGAGALALRFGAGEFRLNAWHWYLGDAWGAILVGTALLAVLTPRHRGLRRPDPARPVERAVLIAVVAATTAGAYLTGSHVLQWLVLPLIVTVALRAGLRSTGIAILVSTVIAEVAVSTGHGLSGRLTRAEALDALQGYLGVTMLCGVLLAVETIRRHRLHEALVAAERQRLEADLLRSRRFEAIGHRAGGLAHDFNNLLGVVRNYAEHLLRNDALTPVIRDDVGQIAEAASRGGELVHRLLTMVREDHLEPTELDLGVVVTDLVELLQVPFAPHHLAVDSAERVLVFGDRLELDRMLLNLLCNARDAIPGAGAGRITVTVRGEVLAGARSAVLEVRDDGVGMAPTVAARAFDPLFSTKGQAASAGLGLPTVRAIVERHGGTVTIASSSGDGTVVTVRLPLVDGGVPRPAGATAGPADRPIDLRTAPGAAPTGAPVPPPTSAPADPAGPRAATRAAALAEVGRGRAEVVLVVDDEPAARREATRLLHKLGYATVSLDSGSAALEALGRSAMPDVVLSDVMMAGVGGLELAEHIAAHHPKLPVVLMSADAELHAGSLRWPLVRKPLTADELAEALVASAEGGAAIGRPRSAPG